MTPTSDWLHGLAAWCLEHPWAAAYLVGTAWTAAGVGALGTAAVVAAGGAAGAGVADASAAAGAGLVPPEGRRHEVGLAGVCGRGLGVPRGHAF